MGSAVGLGMDMVGSPWIWPGQSDRRAVMDGADSFCMGPHAEALQLGIGHPGAHLQHKCPSWRYFVDVGEGPIQLIMGDYSY